MQNLIPKHGGYRQLKSFQTAEIIYDLNVEFCNRYLSNPSHKAYKSYRTYDQMIQAGRSGKQNIAEGSKDSATSKTFELKLVNIARGSLEELLLDYEDFLRINNLRLWDKNDPRVLAIRQLAYEGNRTDGTYRTYMTEAESAANCLICLINQANYLLDRQLKSLSGDFAKHGDFRDRVKEAKRQEAIGESPINEAYLNFLKQQGFRLLPNGRVVKMDDPAGEGE